MVIFALESKNIRATERRVIHWTLKKNQRIWCNFFSKSLWKVKYEVVRKFRYLFSQNWQQLYGNLSTHCFNWEKRMGVHSPGSCTTSYKYQTKVNIFVLNYWLYLLCFIVNVIQYILSCNLFWYIEQNIQYFVHFK